MSAPISRQFDSDHSSFVQANTTFGVDPKVFVNNWISARIADAVSLNKPLVIEEFGKQLPVPADAATIASVRDPIFADIYAALQNTDIVKGMMQQLCICHAHDHVLFTVHYTVYQISMLVGVGAPDRDCRIDSHAHAE